jgi:hypothetical protein
MHGLPGPAFDSLIQAMAEVIDYLSDPLRTFPTSDPYVRRVEFGGAGLITYLINDGVGVVIILDITWLVSRRTPGNRGPGGDRRPADRGASRSEPAGRWRIRQDRYCPRPRL